jgi:hypothetical protein
MTSIKDTRLNADFLAYVLRLNVNMADIMPILNMTRYSEDGK